MDEFRPLGPTGTHNEGIVSARLQCGLKPAIRLETLTQILITLIQGNWCFVRSRTGRLRMNIFRQNVGLTVQKNCQLLQ
jgi:hypothetical protein